MAEYKIIFKSGKIKNVVSKDVNKIKNYITESFKDIQFIKRLDEETIIPNNGSTEKIQKLLSLLIIARETSKLNHWNSTSNGEHLGYDHIVEVLDENIDKLAETYFMARKIEIISPFGQYETLLNEDIGTVSLERILEVLNTLVEEIASDEINDEATKSLVSSIGENVQQSVALLRLTKNDSEEVAKIASEESKEETSEE